MSIAQQEKEAAAYILGLETKEERQAAAHRIAQLIAAQAPPEDAAPDPPPVRALGQYLDEKIETPPFLVCRGQVVRGEITVMIARAGKGKTTFGMNRLIRWSAGLPLFDELKDSQVPEKPLKMLLIENEGAAYFMQEKLGILLEHGGGLTDEQRALARENLLVWGDGGYSGLKIDRADDLDLLRRACDEYSPDIVMLEPFRGIWRGEENDATAMEAVLDDLVALGAEFGCGIMLAHHERKSGAGEDGEEMSRARGSGDLEGKVAVMENWRSVKDGEFRELLWSKSRYDHPAEPIRLAFNHNKWRYELVGDDEISKAILGMMSDDPDGWYMTAEICEELNESDTKIRKSLDTLREQDRVVRKKVEKGSGFRYRLKYDEDEQGKRGLSI